MDIKQKSTQMEKTQVGKTKCFSGCKDDPQIYYFIIKINIVYFEALPQEKKKLEWIQTAPQCHTIFNTSIIQQFNKLIAFS